MRDAKLCPVCGFLLRYQDPPDPSFGALRYVAVQLLAWAALVLFLAFLWAPPEVSEWYGAAAVIAFAGWLWQRRAQRVRAQALLARRRYFCAQCKREFGAGDLS